jgi:MoaA/NifB/PqqE/SkfB family radical SAM enzyme
MATENLDLKRRGTWPRHETSLPEKTHHAFNANGSVKDQERLKKARKDEGIYGVNLTVNMIPNQMVFARHYLELLHENLKDT